MATIDEFISQGSIDIGTLDAKSRIAPVTRAGNYHAQQGSRPADPMERLALL